MKKNLDLMYFEKCISILEVTFNLLNEIEENESEIKINAFCTACVRYFEIILEQSGKLLKTSLEPYFAISKDVDYLNFKDVFRNASKFRIIDAESCRRWIKYRDERNDTAHNYGVELADGVLKILPSFIKDAKQLALSINNLRNKNEAERN